MEFHADKARGSPMRPFSELWNSVSTAKTSSPVESVDGKWRIDSPGTVLSILSLRLFELQCGLVVRENNCNFCLNIVDYCFKESERATVCLHQSCDDQGQPHVYSSLGSLKCRFCIIVSDS